MEPLVLDAEALQKLGLYHKALYTIEYDLPRESNNFDKETNYFVRMIRNKVVFMLKFKLHAIRNLDSSWFIDENVLDKATELLNQVKKEYASHNPPFNMDRRIRIIPILTTNEGYESYEDKKAEFLLQFLNEAIQKVEKGVADEIMSESILWRCKKTVEIVESIAESLTNHEQYKVIQDTIVMLVDSINGYEDIKQHKKASKKNHKK